MRSVSPNSYKEVRTLADSNKIETKKHSKCRKWEGGRFDMRCNFYEKRAFFIVFEGVFSLEWFGRKMCFVKYIYHINNSLMAKW